MKKLIFTALLISANAQAQTTLWSDDFENASSWTLNQTTGTNGLDANQWYLNDDEGGVAAGSCGVATNGNKTLHIGCQGQWCVGTGAIYNTGDGGLGFIDATTSTRAVWNSNISTVGQSNLTLSFDWIGVGQTGSDYSTVIYSADGGTTWQNLQAITGGTTCPSGQGLWQASSIPLPVACSNISSLRVGFNWVNNNDGAGSDPSFAVNNIRITTPSGSTPPTASFSLSQGTICQGECISFTNQSTGSPTSWSWNFGDGTTSTLQNPPVHCYPTAGTVTVSLTVTNAAGTNTSTQNLTVDALPNVTVQNNGGTLSVQSSNGTYQWVQCPAYSAISGATGMSYTPTANGQYAVIVTTANGCTDTSTCTTIQGLSINDLSIESIQLVPTVFGESFTLKGLGTSVVSLSLYALNGAEVFRIEHCSEGQVLTPQVSNGFYIAKVILGNEVISQERVIKM